MAKKPDVKYLECTTGSANKFYNVEILKNDQEQFVVRCHWGRIGTKGQYQDKGTYHAEYRATNMRDKLIRQKKQKGYEDVTAKKAKEAPKKEKAKDKPVTKHEVSLSRFTDLWE